MMMAYAALDEMLLKLKYTRPVFNKPQKFQSTQLLENTSETEIKQAGRDFFGRLPDNFTFEPNQYSLNVICSTQTILLSK